MSRQQRQASLKQSRPQQCGFTLIEILAVMLVVGVLAAVAIPKF